MTFNAASEDLQKSSLCAVFMSTMGGSQEVGSGLVVRKNNAKRLEKLLLTAIVRQVRPPQMMLHDELDLKLYENRRPIKGA